MESFTTPFKKNLKFSNCLFTRLFREVLRNGMIYVKKVWMANWKRGIGVKATRMFCSSSQTCPRSTYHIVPIIMLFVHFGGTYLVRLSSIIKLFTLKFTFTLL
jgi:hypothetical protein